MRVGRELVEELLMVFGWNPEEHRHGRPRLHLIPGGKKTPTPFVKRWMNQLTARRRSKK